MGKPAARIGDMHMCPMVTPGVPPIPHVGGPVVGPGCPTVLIGGMPAAVMGDMCTCVGPPDSIILGSVGVLIGGKPAARMGDMCAHGGMIAIGCPTVLIGEIMPAVVTPVVVGPGMMGAPPSMIPGKVNPIATLSAEPQVMASVNMTAAFATKFSRMQALIEGAENGTEMVHAHNENECKVQYKVADRDNNPAKDMKYEIRTSDGQVFSGTTDSSGMTQQISGYTEGMCTITFPD